MEKRMYTRFAPKGTTIPYNVRILKAEFNVSLFKLYSDFDTLDNSLSCETDFSY